MGQRDPGPTPSTAPLPRKGRVLKRKKAAGMQGGKTWSPHWQDVDRIGNRQKPAAGTAQPLLGPGALHLFPELGSAGPRRPPGNSPFCKFVSFACAFGAPVSRARAPPADRAEEERETHLSSSQALMLAPRCGSLTASDSRKVFSNLWAGDAEALGSLPGRAKTRVLPPFRTTLPSSPIQASGLGMRLLPPTCPDLPL